MKLFPFVLCRISGDDFDRFSDFLQTSELDSSLSTWHECNRQKEDFKQSVSEQLRKHIESLKNAREQNDIQNFRRDLYNDRSIKETDWVKIMEMVPVYLKDQLSAYQAVCHRLNILKQDMKGAYDRAVLNGREQIKSLASRESLKKGLLLASNSLFQQLARYEDTPQSEFGKRELQIEGSLLQYLSRIYTKTSPLSTFTNLTMGTLQRSSSGEPLVFKERNDLNEDVKSYVRLNNSLFHSLRVILSIYRPAYLNLPIKLNPTIVRSESHYSYLINSQNIESFQQLKINPVVEKVVQLLQTDPYLFGSLVKTVIGSVQATEEELEKYLRQLVRYGLLEFDFGISGIDPEWDSKLIALLRTWPVDPELCFPDIIRVLGLLQQLKTQYATATIQARKEILDQGHEAFKDMYLRLHEAAELPATERYVMAASTEGRNLAKEAFHLPTSFSHIESTAISFKQESLFYEDTVRNIDFSIDHHQVVSCVEKIDKLMRHSTMFKIYEGEKGRMSRFFTRKYGSGSAIPVLDFYRDYHAEVKKPDLKERELIKSELNAKPSPAKPEIIEEKFAKVQEWTQGLADIMRSQKGLPEVNIDIKLFETGLPFEATPSNGPANSHGAFLQFFCDEKDGKFKAVVNRTFPGYGKMLSRFLHLFDENVVDALRIWNTKLAKPDELFIENCDASFYNANIHPCLMPYEIRLPGSHNSLPAERQLDVSQFEVVADQSNSISIFHKTSGKRAYFFDLAFQASAGRSNLFQLLQPFSRAEYMYLDPLCHAINNATKGEQIKDNTIHIVPRIVYEEMIVIQRKSWIIPKMRLPVKSKPETDADYYVRLNVWRREHGIPDEVFIVARQRSEVVNKTGRSKDDYKPQYINFKNPFLVRLLSKLLDKVNTALLVQEMLPASDQLFRINGHRHVSEFVVQWYEF